MKEGSELVFGEMMTDRGWDVDKELSGRKYRREEVSSIGGRAVNSYVAMHPQTPSIPPHKEGYIQVHHDVPENINI
jgi:hypothetical protein